MPATSIVFPESQEWVGIARELIAGTGVSPVVSIPADKMEPDEKPVWLEDKGLRGQMTTEFGLIQGTESADFSLNGPVYIDTIGHLLFNIFGDYSATGSSPTHATTFTAPLALGATSGTLTTSTGYAIGSICQIDTAPIAEVVVLTGLAGANATWANNPCRFAHTGTPAVSIVAAPFTHTFALLNSGYGQPVTHTLTFHQGISATYFARQYAYFCASEIAFTANATGLFSHTTKGMSFLGAIPSVAPVNTFDTALAQAAWETKIGIGGPAAGGTLISDVEESGITLTRTAKPIWTAANQQAPFIIARNELNVGGSFKELAQSEQPMLNMLNNVQPQIQIIISNGLTGASLLSATFNLQQAAYDTAKLSSNGVIEYDVSFKAIANSTNVGGSAGLGPATVILQNATPTY